MDSLIIKTEDLAEQISIVVVGGDKKHYTMSKYMLLEAIDYFIENKVDIACEVQSKGA